MTRLLHIAAACALAFAARGAVAAETTYALDPVHTRVMFSVSHAGFSNPMFTVAGTTGTLVFDPDDWSKAHVEATIPMKGLELTDAKWRAAVLGRNFLEAEKYPEAKFVSTRIQPIDATHATMFGTLTLRNVSREVKLDVVLHQIKNHPLPPFRRTAGFSATGMVSRGLFSISAWPNVVGDKLEIRIEAEGTRSRGGGDTNAGATAPASAASTMPAPDASTMPAPDASVAPPAASEPTTPP